MRRRYFIIYYLSFSVAIALFMTGCHDWDDVAGGTAVTSDQVIRIGGVSTDGLAATTAVTRTDPDPVDEETVQRTDAENVSWLVGPLKAGLDITYGNFDSNGSRTNSRVAILKLLTETNGDIKYSVDGSNRYAQYSFLYRDDTDGSPTDNPAIWHDNGAHFFEGLHIPDRIKYRNEAQGEGLPAQTVENVYGTGGTAVDLITDQHDDGQYVSSENDLGNYTLLSHYLGMPSNFTLNATVARVKLPFRHRLARVLAYILIDPEMGDGVTIDGYMKDAQGETTTDEDATTSRIRFCNVKVLAGVKDSYNASTKHHTYTPQWTQVRKAIPHFVGERGSYDDSQNLSRNDEHFIAYYDTQKKTYVYPTDAQWTTLNGLTYDNETNQTSDGTYERTIYGKVPVYDLIVQPTYTALNRVMYDEDLSVKSKQDYYVATNQIEFEITLNNGLQYTKVFNFDLDANYQTVVYLHITRERVDYNSSGSDLWVESIGYDDWYGVNNQNGNTLSYAGSSWQRAYTFGTTSAGTEHPSAFDDVVTDGHFYTQDSEDLYAQYVDDATWIEMLREACVGGKHHGDYFILHNDISIPAAAFPTDFVFTGHLDGQDHTITLTDASYTAAHDEYETYNNASDTKYVLNAGNYEVFTPDPGATYCDGSNNVISDISSYSGSTAYIRTVESTTYEVVNVGGSYNDGPYYDNNHDPINDVSTHLSSKGAIYTMDVPTYTAVSSVEDLASGVTYYQYDNGNYVPVTIGTIYIKDGENYTVVPLDNLVSRGTTYYYHHDTNGYVEIGNITTHIGTVYTKTPDTYTAVADMNSLNPTGTDYYYLDGSNYVPIADINTYIGIYRQVITYSYTPINFYKFVHYESVIGSSTGAPVNGYLFAGLNGKYSTAQESDASATWEANVHREVKDGNTYWVPYKSATDGWRAEVINTNISGGTLFKSTAVYGTDVTGYVHNCWTNGTFSGTPPKWSGTKVQEYTPSLPEY